MSARTLNVCYLVGNAGRNPTEVPGPVKAVRFTLVTDKSEGANKEVEVHHLVAYSKVAYVALEMVKKGALVMVQGRLVYPDGKPEIIVRELIVMSPREAIH